jgi:class 3 adenylate cyclase
MDVAAWLQGLGLERYAPAFRDNEIDWDALPKLSAEDLKDLGVVLGSHRRRLLDAIAALGAAVLAASATAAPRAAPAPAEAERRQLTVMFCDLVGSTALSTRHDPEDLRELIGGYHRAVADTVSRFDGFVAKYMGDGVLIYFGYPQAHEDDAERAVRAGLAVIEAVGKLPARQDLRVRLGIATGLAVVGDLIGEGAAQERGVVGETPNLAARLQALAMPNTLVIAEATRRQVGGLFDLADLGPQALAGFAEPQPAWRVLGESGMLSRFEALRSGETPLVGRDEEIELLTRRWQQAKSGDGRVVLISGEPGIGKSRLTAALSEHIGTEPHTRLRYFCSSHHQDSAFYPVIVQLERAAGFARDDGPETKLDKLAALFAPAAEDGDVSLLVELLSLPGGDRYAPLELSPQRKKELTFTALLRQLEGLARQQAVLVIFEDLHWIDPRWRRDARATPAPCRPHPPPSAGCSRRRRRRGSQRGGGSRSFLRQPGLAHAVHTDGQTFRWNKPRQVSPVPGNRQAGLEFEHAPQAIARFVEATELGKQDHLDAERGSKVRLFVQRAVRPFEGLFVSTRDQMGSGEVALETRT